MRRVFGFVLAALVSVASQAAPVTVSFSGTLDQFVTGPFAANTHFFGTFELDTSVAVSPINRFLGAVDNLQLTIGGNTFYADNGDLNQVILPAEEALVFSFPEGTTSGAINGLSFESMSLEMRGPDLFSNVSAMVSTNLGISDFTYLSATFDFGVTTDWVIVRNAEFSSVDVSAVPVPAAIWLFLPALLGVLGFRTRRK